MNAILALRTAAKLIEDGNFLATGSACWAIVTAVDGGKIGSLSPLFVRKQEEPIRTAWLTLRDYFEPEDKPAFWWGNDEDDARIIALCMAAAILESPHKGRG